MYSHGERNEGCCPECHLQACHQTGGKSVSFDLHGMLACRALQRPLTHVTFSPNVPSN